MIKPQQRYLLAYGVMLLTFAILDGVWLGVVAKNLYAYSLSGLLRSDLIVWPWIIFYLGYCGAILYLAVIPSRRYRLTAFVRGAVLGAAAYGAYNLTCYSIIADWPIPITLIDWMWGTTATALVSISGAMTFRYTDK
ncbi:DUF2177 family protein [Aestuariibacter sp. GS-14]|uniref:DUF2177 family protein n=1 Tax=Alteromonadaceae TaxID=72275 RepID=UPI001128631F|nr:DUF2177 family protein [Aestuariibacter sp. GS-14]TPV59158.1 DUF2177 family protein [Aestuariibacter sp. GS-14]